jgi:subfamily B ATP-binding cassette protein MsbA
MTTFQRLAGMTRPFRRDLIGGLIHGIISIVLETGVVNALAAGMVGAIVGSKIVNSMAGPATGGNSLRPHFLDTHKYQHLVSQLQAIFNHFVSFFVHKDNKLELLVFFAIITGITVLLKCAFQARGSYLMNRFANRVARDVRQSLFSHMTILPPAYYETEQTGSQLSRITADVVTLQSCLGPQLAEVLQAPVTIAVSMVMMFFVSWRLMLVVLAIAPLVALLVSACGKQIRKVSVSMQVRLGELNAGLIERLTNIRVIQSFVRERYENSRISLLNQTYYKETMKSVLITETLSPAVEFIAWVGMLAGAILGGNEVLNGRMSMQGFMLFILLGQKAGSQFKRLSRVNQLKQQTYAAADRIFSTLDIVPEIQDAPDASPLPPSVGHIVFEQVGFRYRTGNAVLREISFTVEPGEVIAFVGPSGSGKTTLVNLLPRFYDVIAGSITIDGLDIRHVTLDSLREQVGIVPQETLLFSGSIYENIQYGKLNATREEITEAARSANALEFIDRLPKRFDTIVGERGARLSGGQRQRIAIARALLKNPRILILDEATSALDTESEHLVQQALDRLMLNRTTFVIAHRLSTVKNASRILVLDRGRIVESGAHQQLLDYGGLYARLYEMQFSTDTEVEGAIAS